jgi:hypothetical protein
MLSVCALRTQIPQISREDERFHKDYMEKERKMQKPWADERIRV